MENKPFEIEGKWWKLTGEFRIPRLDESYLECSDGSDYYIETQVFQGITALPRPIVTPVILEPMVRKLTSFPITIDPNAKLEEEVKIVVKLNLLDRLTGRYLGTRGAVLSIIPKQLPIITDDTEIKKLPIFDINLLSTG